MLRSCNSRREACDAGLGICRVGKPEKRRPAQRGGNYDGGVSAWTHTSTGAALRVGLT
jgi:hypothetical protein